MGASLPGYKAGRTITPREILYVMEENQGLYLPGGGLIDSSKALDGANTSYTHELRAGWIMAQITASKKWVPLKRSLVNGVNGKLTAVVVDNAGAFKAGDVVSIGGQSATNIAAIAGAVTDDNSAATNGTAVYLHIDEKAQFGIPAGHLESVTAGNANSLFTIGSGGPDVRVNDDDAAATGGLQVYFDEDADPADSRFKVNNTLTGEDVWVFATDGRAIKFKHSANAATEGVALYFDDDGASSHARLLFVSPTDTAGAYETDESKVFGTGTTKVNTTNTISSIDYATNTLTLSAAVDVNDGDPVYAEDGSGIARGILADHIDLHDADGNAVDQVGKILIDGKVNQAYLLGDVAAVIASWSSHLMQGIQIYSGGVRQV